MFSPAITMAGFISQSVGISPQTFVILNGAKRRSNAKTPVGGSEESRFVSKNTNAYVVHFSVIEFL